VLRLEQLDGPQRIVRPHGKIVANRQHRQVNALFADQAHVAEQAGVTGQIDFAPVRRGKQEAGRIASVRPIG